MRRRARAPYTPLRACSICERDDPCQPRAAPLRCYANGTGPSLCRWRAATPRSACEWQAAALACHAWALAAHASVVCDPGRASALVVAVADDAVFGLSTACPLCPVAPRAAFRRTCDGISGFCSTLLTPRVRGGPGDAGIGPRASRAMVVRHAAASRATIRNASHRRAGNAATIASAYAWCESYAGFCLTPAASLRR